MWNAASGVTTQIEVSELWWPTRRTTDSGEELLTVGEMIGVGGAPSLHTLGVLVYRLRPSSVLAEPTRCLLWILCFRYYRIHIRARLNVP